MKRFSPAYWNLIREFAFTSLKVRYKNSVLGFFWSVGKPLMFLGVLYVITTYIMKAALPKPPALFLLLGIITWNFFAEGSSLAATCVFRKAGLVDKMSFPAETFLLGDMAMASITYFLNLLVFFLFYFGSGLWPSPRWLYFLLIWPILLMFIAGVGGFLAAWMQRFRDLEHIWEVVLQIWFWATPVFYMLPAHQTGPARLLAFSPITRLITLMRAALLPNPDLSFPGILTFHYIWSTLAASAGACVIGVWCFLRRAPYFAEEL
jgi:ABC-type polysaccharide/polyol phosphate export permease